MQCSSMTPLSAGEPRLAPFWSAEDLGILTHFLTDDQGAPRSPIRPSVGPPHLVFGPKPASGTGSSSDPDPDAPPLTKEEKLRRKYQRRYRRRVGRMQELRDAVTALEAQLERLSLRQKEKNNDPAFPSGLLLGNNPADEELELALALALRSGSDGTHKLSLSEALSRLSAMRMRLQHENAQLKRMFHESTRRMHLVRELFSAEQKSFVTVNGGRSFVRIKPLSSSECVEIRKKAMEEYRVFSTNEQYVRFTSTTSGWLERRMVENGVVNYVLQKVYYNQSAAFCAELAWRLLTDPIIMQSVYSAELQMHCYVVQHVDEDNVVILQEYVVDGSQRVKSLYLVSRESDAVGYMEVIRGLGSDRLEFFDNPNAPPVEDDSAPEIWNDVFMWNQQKYHGEKNEHTVGTVSGITPLVGSNPRFWVTEIMLEVIKGEEICFGPKFSLPPSED